MGIWWHQWDMLACQEKERFLDDETWHREEGAASPAAEMTALMSCNNCCCKLALLSSRTSGLDSVSAAALSATPSMVTPPDAAILDRIAVSRYCLCDARLYLMHRLRACKKISEEVCVGARLKLCWHSWRGHQACSWPHISAVQARPTCSIEEICKRCQGHSTFPWRGSEELKGLQCQGSHNCVGAVAPMACSPLDTY